jgi:hypothetical protein
VTTTAKEPSSADRFGLAAPFGYLLYVWLAAVAFLAVGFIYAVRIGFGNTDSHFLRDQDLPVLALSLLLTAALAFVPAIQVPRIRASMAAAPLAWTLGLASLCALAGVFGAPLVFDGYPMSLDKFMADFNARIFAHGQLMAPIGPQWRPFAFAMQPSLMISTPGYGFWASSYLPVNSAVRALAGQASLQDWVNPLFSAFSVVAVFGVARRLWPARPSLALIAAGLLASSSQLIVTSMTAYAMPGHLAFNLAWLWLFLRGGRIATAATLLVGFLAAGLHQFLFHLIFVAPFVAQLWLDRRWRLAALYTLAYALIALFWIEYWQLAFRVVGVSAVQAKAAGGGWVAQRVAQILGLVGVESLGAMAQALIRFATWQNPLAAPLALAGMLAAWRAKGVLRALVLGVLVTLLAMLVLAATPMHGWGYRYLHGLLGSVALLAAWSWARLTDNLSAERKAAAGTALALSCAVSLVVLTPLRAWQASTYVRPYREASAQIQAAPAQVVLVDNQQTLGFDPGVFTRNDPYLANSPKVMMLAAMDEPTLRQLCGRYGVAIFDGANAAAHGIDTEPYPTPAATVRLRALMSTLHCGERLPDESGGGSQPLHPRRAGP